MRSIACWSSDARTMSASDEPRRGWGSCVHVPDPCTTATGGQRPRPSGVCGGLFPPHPPANQLVEHLLGPVLGFGRLVQAAKGGDDLEPPLRQGGGRLLPRVLGYVAGREEREPAAGSGGVLQQDPDGQGQVVVHAGPGPVELIQVGPVVGVRETLQLLKLGVVVHGSLAVARRVLEGASRGNRFAWNASSGGGGARHARDRNARPAWRLGRSACGVSPI